MILETPEVKRTINDYDILFDSGYLIPLSVDVEAGDTIDFDDKAILVHIVSKPSKTVPNALVPAQDITIFTPHIISINHRTREVVNPSPNEQAAWNKTWDTLLPPTVQ